MAKFQLGATVLKYDSTDRGTIVEVAPARRGRQIYRVNWGSKVTDELEEDLVLDYDVSDPFERCSNAIFGTYSEYSKKNTTFKIKSSNNSTISSLKASKTLFRAYQFKPLLKYLNSPSRRLLVADEVGLGKTIEAGHIMLELKARRELQNVLIVCPKSLQEKWKMELQEKFGLTFRIYEKPKELLEELQYHNGQVKAIINYEKIRFKKNDTKKAEQTGEPDNLISYLTDSGRKFSLVVCDEAHRLRNTGTLIYGGAEILMSLSDSALFLTATPVMISNENLYNLLHLLDNTRYFNYQIFSNLMEQNRPFIIAISALNANAPLSSIKAELSGAEIYTSYSADEREIYSNYTTVADAFKDDPIYKEIMELLDGEDNYKNRARLQYLLNSISVMNSVFSRTRKREVTMDMSQAERKPHLVKVQLAEEEQEYFDEAIDEYITENSYVDSEGEMKMDQSAVLGLITKKKQIASSVFAFMNTEEDLYSGYDAYANYSDGKVDRLVEIIKEVFKHGTQKIIIFAEFRKTLHYLQIRLKERGYNSLIIHGQIHNRAEIIDEFKNNPNIHILLSSKVGSEGLDMQFCNSMVNYDLPWNPMDIEQRIGRIDRFGQLSEVVNIYSMVVAGSIQEDIYERLLTRIGIFKGTIGDMEAILDAPSPVDGKISIRKWMEESERELFVKKLTPQERIRKMEEVAQAIENERENIRHLDEGLNNTLTNDSYFRDEIDRILKKNAYVTEIELRNYIESVIAAELTTCRLDDLGGGIFEFVVPVSEPRALRNFLVRYQPTGEEYDQLFNSFIRSLDDKLTFRLTFKQELAYEDRHLIFVNIYHPLICACQNYFQSKDDKISTSFSYALKADDMMLSGGHYFLAVYKLVTSRMVQGIKKTSAELFPVLYDALTQNIVTDTDLVDHLFGLSQTAGREHNPDAEYINKEIIQDMRYDFLDAIHGEIKSRIDEIKRTAESERQRNDLQTREYYRSLIDSRETSIEEWESRLRYSRDWMTPKEVRELEGAIRLGKANVEAYRKAMEDRLSIINADPGITIEEEILSLNLVCIL